MPDPTKPPKPLMKSFYDFETLHDALVFFNVKGIEACDVRLGGAFGLGTPTEDDVPVFMWEEKRDEQR